MNNISLADLAEEIRVSPEELVPLVTSGYLVVAQTAEHLKDTLVGKPTQQMIDWFRSMFGPVVMRPIMPIKEVAGMMRMKLNLFVDLCERFHLAIYDDPIFGGLVSARTVFTFLKMYAEAQNPMRMDRQTMLVALGRIKGNKLPRTRRPENIFSSEFEKEIQRIAKLAEPQRTIAATAFWQVFTDSDLFTDLVRDKKQPKKRTAYTECYRLLKDKAQGVEKILRGKSTWEKEPYRLVGRGNMYHPAFGWQSKLTVARRSKAALDEYWRKRKAAEAALRGGK